jgi:hypothetical protein
MNRFLSRFKNLNDWYAYSLSSISYYRAQLGSVTAPADFYVLILFASSRGAAQDGTAKFDY